MALRAVLLDFDGVIADTENHHIAAWQRTLAALGWQVPDEVAARSADVDDREFLRDLLAVQQITDGDIDGWVRKKQALTISMLRDAPRVYPGVQELVRQLRGRVRLAVVSDTWRENIEVVLSTSGLLAAFELIVGKEDVRSVKPDPEAYLPGPEPAGTERRRNRGDRGFSNGPGRRPCRRDSGNRRRTSSRIRRMGWRFHLLLWTRARIWAPTAPGTRERET